ncbi:hypothetical protein FA95DRAFT_1613308 [Auriscalpium vulgare]|uniref:Uncharacterized protein n=1 Tax=Auriscalpium vulgare TaxID=40419 RepID=A0ACB8R3U1_9AGAM|nr:hypothetical protein FA95DRAFT_1613308 [Auriscalpium vulgare]
MELFSIRGLYERILHALGVKINGSRATIRPYEKDTRNLSFEDVAMHFASLGYQPRSVSITEIEEYATRRRNIIEGRSPLSSEEWTTSPQLAEMIVRYPPVNAYSQSSGPQRNRYPNMGIDLRTSKGADRATTPEGPTLSPSSGSMSPDFPAHYEPPTPRTMPLAEDVVGPLPPLAPLSWADEPYAVNNILGASSAAHGGSQTDVIQAATVNNIPPLASAVNLASVPLPASRAATPMDASD